MLVPPSDGAFYLLRGDARLHSAGACRMDGLIQLPGLNSTPAEVLSEGEHGACAAALHVRMGVEETVYHGVHVGGGIRVRLRSRASLSGIVSLGKLRLVAKCQCLCDGVLQVAEITLFNIESTSKSRI